jgi:hypothetical protein
MIKGRCQSVRPRLSFLGYKRTVVNRVTSNCMCVVCEVSHRRRRRRLRRRRHAPSPHE